MLKKDAINYFGSGAALARALGVQRAAVSRWPDVLPELRACQVQVVTGGKLTASISSSAPDPSAPEQGASFSEG